MKRRKKAVYVDYDYEAAYQKMLTDLEEDNMCRMLNEGKVRSIYATKEIKAAEQMDIEIYPEFRRGQKEQIPDEEKLKKQRQAQRNLNEKNSRKECERTINANFTDNDIWGTLTYTDGNMPNSMKEAQHDGKELHSAQAKDGSSFPDHIHHNICGGNAGIRDRRHDQHKGKDTNRTGKRSRRTDRK